MTLVVMNTMVRAKTFLMFCTVIFLCLTTQALSESSGTIQLSKTGQTECWDTDGSPIACVGTGQDGEIQAGVAWPEPRFTVTYCDASGPCSDQGVDCDGDESTDVITDNLTGLMWARDGMGIFPWKTALDLTKNLTLCGHSDWRLPNVSEMGSLFHAGVTSLREWLNSQGFKVAEGPVYWTSTTRTWRPDGAWVVDLQYGENGSGNKKWTFYILPVRGETFGPARVRQTGQRRCYNVAGNELVSCTGTGQDGEFQAGVPWPTPRFTAEGNCVTDNLTGLMWVRNLSASSVPSSTWQNALDYSNALTLCAYSDWRLPNIIEIGSLMHYGRTDPGIWVWFRKNGFIVPEGAVPWDNWTSTSQQEYPARAWEGLGPFLDQEDKDIWYYYAWAVRSGVSPISVTPTDRGFGTVKVGKTSVTKQVTISNRGTAELAITSIMVKGNAAAMFDVISGGDTPCLSLTPTLAPGSSCTVAVGFKPQFTGPKSAFLEIAALDVAPSLYRYPTLSGVGVTGPVTVFTPNGGEILGPGTGQSISWGALPGAKTFNVMYSTDGGLTWTDIVTSTERKAIDWDLPKPMGSTNCLIRVVAYDGWNQEIASDESDGPFTIKALRITSPNGGETCTSGQTCWITWVENVERDNVSIYYSLNSGLTWKAICKDGCWLERLETSYPWIPPVVAEPENRARVKVTLWEEYLDYKDIGYRKLGNDKSDGDFTIAPGIQSAP
jgi:hypothetical protein